MIEFNRLLRISLAPSDRDHNPVPREDVSLWEANVKRMARNLLKVPYPNRPEGGHDRGEADLSILVTLA